MFDLRCCSKNGGGQETLPNGKVQHIFRRVSDQRVQLTGAKGNPIYRLVTF
jgi:hypothetical protein